MTADGLKAIRFGANQFEVVVTKRATGRCNGKRGVQYAVEFAFNGAFHADAAGSTGPVTGTGGCGGDSCGGTTTVAFRLTNNGPATMLEPRIVMSWNFPDPDTVVAPYFSADATARCITTMTDSRSYHVVCEGTPFPARATAVVHVKFSWLIPRPQSGVVQETWSYMWSFPGAYGAFSQTPTSASGTRNVTVCAPPGPMCTAPTS
jgi:hypothetical protein